MTLNEKVINYKFLDLVILYIFYIKFDFIRDHMKIYEFFLGGTIFRDGSSPAPKNAFIGTGDAITHH
jgi:hypothetical protein